MPRKKQSSFDPRLLIIGGVLLLVVAIALVVFQNYPQTASATPTASGPSPEIERVSLVDAKAALDSGTAIFLDVRGVDAYNLGHIPGSISIPYTDVEARLSELDTTRWIITYCT